MQRLALFAVCSTLLAPCALAADPDHCGLQAEALLSALDAADYAAARKTFNQRMLDSLSEEKMAQLWSTLPQQVGERQGRGELSVKANDAGGAQAVIPLRHALMQLNLQISCDVDGAVAGMYVKPDAEPAAAKVAEHVAADYVRADAFEEQSLVIQSAGLELPATLTIPRDAGDSLPAVLLVHGSGPRDRDESIGPNRPFKDLAQGLASRGIVVLRYDKRTLVAAQGMVGKAFTVKEEVVDDAVAAIALLRQQPKVDGKRIYVLGHSLGGLVAPRIALEDRHLAGLILAAAPSRQLTTLITEQIAYNNSVDGKLTENEVAAAQHMEQLVKRIEALGKADRDDPEPLLGTPAAYWLDLKSYDPIKTLYKARVPTLVLQGDLDIQVLFDRDYPLWEKSGVRDLQTQRFPGLNHLFMLSRNPPTAEDYLEPGHVDVEVIEAISRWITEQT